MAFDPVARGLAAQALANVGGGSLSVNSSPVSGALAGQILYSDGSLLQAGGAVNASSLALGGATIGSNALAVNGSISFTGGAIASIYTGIGTISSGTVTPDPANGQFQAYTANGAHTLAPPSIAIGKTSVIQLVITNGASAAAITTSGFTTVTGDTPTTANTAVFEANIYAENAYSRLTWKGPR